jgi:flagellar basal-body rod protein FlgG
MLDSLYIAATGMNAQQLNVDTISNNLANVNTNSFKRNRVQFADLMYREVSRGNRPLGIGSPNRYGVGVGVAATGKLFTAGDVKKTDLPLDLAIRGKGSSRSAADNSIAYTRGSSLRLDKGVLAPPKVTGESAVRVPVDALASPSVWRQVLATVPDERIRSKWARSLVDFVNPGALRPLGDNLYVPTENPGEPISGKPGEQGLGLLRTSIFQSTGKRLINLIIAQRAPGANSRAIQASDEMLGSPAACGDEASLPPPVVADRDCRRARHNAVRRADALVRIRLQATADLPGATYTLADIADRWGGSGALGRLSASSSARSRRGLPIR